MDEKQKKETISVLEEKQGNNHAEISSEALEECEKIAKNISKLPQYIVSASMNNAIRNINHQNNLLSESIKKAALPSVSKAMQDAIQPSINALKRTNLSSDALSRLKQNLPEFATVNSEFAKLQIKSTIDSLQTRVSASFAEIFRTTNFANILNPILSELKDYLTSQQSEEKINDLILAHEKWGQYGWTLPPNGSVHLFDNIPSDKKTADSLMREFDTPERLKAFFQDFESLHGYKKDDYNDILFCFENRRYKPCAMMLCAAIDAKLIRLQGRSKAEEGTKKNRNRRKVGSRAAELFCKRLEGELIPEMYVHLAILRGVEQCINVYFADGNDFKTQPDFSNRNFLDHGMLTKRVRRRDCIQLFLLYYNVLRLAECVL